MKGAHPLHHPRSNPTLFGTVLLLLIWSALSTVFVAGEGGIRQVEVRMVSHFNSLCPAWLRSDDSVLPMLDIVRIQPANSKVLGRSERRSRFHFRRGCSKNQIRVRLALPLASMKKDKLQHDVRHTIQSRKWEEQVHLMRSVLDSH